MSGGIEPLSPFNTHTYLLMHCRRCLFNFSFVLLRFVLFCWIFGNWFHSIEKLCTMHRHHAYHQFISILIFNVHWIWKISQNLTQIPHVRPFPSNNQHNESTPLLAFGIVVEGSNRKLKHQTFLELGFFLYKMLNGIPNSNVFSNLFKIFILFSFISSASHSME